jgi:trigger factor
MAREQAIVKALVEASAVDIPDALVERELAGHLDSLDRSLHRQGLRLDRYLEYLGKTPEQWIAEERPEAEARLKVDLVLDEFARREQIEPSDEEVNRYIEEQAAEDDELKSRMDELKKGSSSRRFFTSRLRRLRVLERLGQVAGGEAASQS